MSDMARYARIENGKVAAIEVFDLPKGLVVGRDIFAHMDMVECLDEMVVAGWEYSPDEGFGAPPAAPLPTKDELIAHARHMRWRREEEGFTWQGLKLATDLGSQVKTAGARIKAQSDQSYETTWHGKDGSAVVTAALIIEMSDAMIDFIDETFTQFDQLHAKIMAGSITTLGEVEAAFN